VTPINYLTNMTTLRNLGLRPTCWPINNFYRACKRHKQQYYRVYEVTTV